MKANPSKHNMSRRQLCRTLPSSSPTLSSPYPSSLPPMSYSCSSLIHIHFPPIIPPPVSPLTPFSLPYHHQQGLDWKWTCLVFTLIHCDLSIVGMALGNSEVGSPSKSNIWFINTGAPVSRRAEVHVIPPQDSGTFDSKRAKDEEGGKSSWIVLAPALSLRLNVRV